MVCSPELSCECHMPIWAIPAVWCPILFQTTLLARGEGALPLPCSYASDSGKAAYPLHHKMARTSVAPIQRLSGVSVLQQALLRMHLGLGEPATRSPSELRCAIPMDSTAPIPFSAFASEVLSSAR